MVYKSISPQRILVSALFIHYILFSACTKKLDEKPDQAMRIPETMADYRAMMDMDILNSYEPVLGECGADNYYITDTRYDALLFNYYRNSYIWAKTVFTMGDQPYDWYGPYLRVNVCNLVLRGLTLKNQIDSVAYGEIKGDALFKRAYAFYGISQVFCKPYDSTSATTDLGIPLRTDPGFDLIFQRSTLQQTYDKITGDLQIAADLLPDLPTVKTRGSRMAALAVLSRVFLSMEKYDKALFYANAALQLNAALINYNQLDTLSLLPFKQFNDEVIFHSKVGLLALLNPNNAAVDSLLYRTYLPDDLRRSLYFRKQNSGLITFKGTYAGSLAPYFGGIAIDEVLLTRAECYARSGKTDEAINDLNILLVTRFKTGTFTKLTPGTTDAVLEKILEERRKELVFRTLRWTDLRRLNKDARFAKTLTRIVDGSTYTLPPNSPRYVYSIPEEEVLFSGIAQNER